MSVKHVFDVTSRGKKVRLSTGGPANLATPLDAVTCLKSSTNLGTNHTVRVTDSWEFRTQKWKGRRKGNGVTDSRSLIDAPH